MSPRPALLLVRHGRPLVDPARPASDWPLDPAAFDDVWALRSRVPAGAAFYCSPEPKARETAQLLTDGDVGVLDGRELERTAGWLADFEAVVRRGFDQPDRPAAPGWETVEDCRSRVVRTVEPVLAAHADEDVVLVGHGTAWTLLAAELTGTPPDLERWARLEMPDVVEVPR